MADCHSGRVKFALIMIYCGHIKLHNIITNPRSDTQHHNQHTLFIINIHQFKYKNQPIARFNDVYNPFIGNH